MRDKERPGAGRPASEEIFVEQCPHRAGEKHVALAPAFAMNDNGAIWPGNIFKIDRQCFLAPHPTIIDQPQQRPIPRISDLTHLGLHAPGGYTTCFPRALWLALD